MFPSLANLTIGAPLSKRKRALTDEEIQLVISLNKLSAMEGLKALEQRITMTGILKDTVWFKIRLTQDMCEKMPESIDKSIGKIAFEDWSVDWMKSPTDINQYVSIYYHMIRPEPQYLPNVILWSFWDIDRILEGIKFFNRILRQMEVELYFGVQNERIYGFHYDKKVTDNLDDWFDVIDANQYFGVGYKSIAHLITEPTLKEMQAGAANAAEQDV